MKQRARTVLAATLVVVCMAGAGASPAAAARKRSFCQYVRQHTFEFTQVFGAGTSPQFAAAASDEEVKRLARVAPRVLRADFKTFRKLLAAIRTGDSAAIAAIAGEAGPASQRILDYVATKCGVTVPAVPSTEPAISVRGS